MENKLIMVLVYAIPVIFAITLHEAAHGYVAKHFGDKTAWMLGRVSLNPIRHIDPLGTILLPLVTVMLSGFMFGWAKPVPVNFANLRHPKRDMFWVAAAGPVSNLIQAMLWAVVAKALMVAGWNSLVAQFWFAVALAGIGWNVVIAVFNLFPVLPLDGGRILASVLPNRISYAYQGTERYGMIILVLLIMTGVLGKLLSPLVYGAVNAIYAIFGLQ